MSIAGDRGSVAGLFAAALLASWVSAQAATKSYTVSPGSTYIAVFAEEDTSPTVVATAATGTITSVRIVQPFPGDPVTWTASGVSTKTVTYSGTSAVTALETWTATNLFGTISVPGVGPAGPPPPEYEIQAREAVLWIKNFRTRHTPLNLSFISDGILGRPGGPLTIQYVGDPPTWAATVTETNAPATWAYTHGWRRPPSQTFVGWDMIAAYAAPNGGIATDSKRA